MTAKQVQSKHPAGWSGQEAPSSVWIWEPVRSGTVHRQGWEPRSQAHPCRLASRDRNHGGRPRDQETQAGEAERLEPRAFRNKEEASSLSIPLSLRGRVSINSREGHYGAIPGSRVPHQYNPELRERPAGRPGPAGVQLLVPSV